MSQPKNIVFIMTDTQDIRHIGAYPGSHAVTPNLDRLATEGMRFDRAYCNSPLCTPARGAIFTGLHPSPNGATYNDATPYQHVPRLGQLLCEAGVRAPYTGKWHLDGGFYDGYGISDGGFEDGWWYDRKCYGEDLGEARFEQYKSFGKLPWDEKLKHAFPAEECWGHRVADRATDFLASVGDEPFVLSVSFDEPHGPYMCPAEFLEAIDVSPISMRDNLNASLTGKPQQQQTMAEKHNTTTEDVHHYLRYYLGCLSFADYQIGRVMEAVDTYHGDDTIIIFTSDHGEMMGSHGLWSKGPVMYEEVTHVPFIMRGPGVAPGSVCEQLVSHVDIVPTMFDFLGKPTPEIVHGRSLKPETIQEPPSGEPYVMISYERFGNGLRPCESPSKETEYVPATKEYYPIRCLVRGHYKLAINLLETDELYHLESDPYEMINLIDDPEHTEARDTLHRLLLQEMQRVDDPVRCKAMAERYWHSEA